MTHIPSPHRSRSLLAELTPRNLALAAGGASGALLIAALGFQAAGYAPCELCILQRWPHLAAVVVAGIVLLTGFRRLWGILGMALAAIATGLAVYHTGVELQWWAGPAACSGGLGDLSQLSTGDLLAQIRGAQVIRCDQPAWVFLGLSMAAWNALISAGLTVLWGASVARARA